MKAELREWVEQNLQRFRVPGAVVAMVDGDEGTVLPFGVRVAGGGDAVTETTAFSIASCSKAFTATAAAILVEQGKLAFDEPVHDILPELELDDPWITSHVTLRDLLAMRIGLLGVGILAHGLNRELPLASVFGRLKHLQRIAGFREAFTYLNPTYTAAAEIVARRSGTSFESFLRDQIFAPLAFSDAFVTENAPPPGSTVALPHFEVGGAIRPLPAPRCGGRVGASGVYLSGRDAVRWLDYLLSGKTSGGGPLLSEPIRQAMQTDQIMYRPDAALGQTFQSYCMGWFASDFRGRRIYTHEGGEYGVRAHTILCPSERFAVAVYTSLASPEAVKSTTYHLLDQACGGSTVDWAEHFTSIEAQMLSANIAGLEQACPIDPDQRRPDLIVGVFDHPAHGRLLLVEDGQQLEARFEDGSVYDCALKPLGGEVFEARCHYPAAEDRLGGHLRVRLCADACGKVTEVSVPGMAATFARID